MQFGIFTVSDVTPDPTTGRTPTRGRADQGHGRHREEGRGGRARRLRDRRAPQPAVRDRPPPPPRSATSRRRPPTLQLSTSTTLITTNDPVKIAEDYAMLQHLADGRVDLMMGRGNTGPVYPWFGQDIRDGIPLAVENYALLRRLWREDVVDWEGKFRTPLQGFTVDPAPARRRPAVRLARLDPQPADRRAGRVLRRRLLPQPHLLAEGAHPADGRALPPPLRALRPRHRRPGDRRPRRSGVHAQEQPGRRARVPPLLRQRPGLRPRPVAGGVHRADAADRRQPAAGHRADPRLPRLRRRLPAPAVPHRPRRPAAEDGARAAGPPRRGGRAGAAQGVRRRSSPPTCPTPRPTPRWSPPPAARATPPSTRPPTTSPARPRGGGA